MVGLLTALRGGVLCVTSIAPAGVPRGIGWRRASPAYALVGYDHAVSGYAGQPVVDSRGSATVAGAFGADGH